MPNPNFEPIIGSSFDAIAGQRANWAGFNANIDAQNIARAQERDRQLSAFAAQEAGGAQHFMDSEAARQQAAQAAATQAAMQARQEQVQQANNRQAYDLEVQRLNAEKARTDAMVRVPQLRQEAVAAQNEVKIDNAGKSYAMEYARRKQALDAVQAEAKKRQDDVDKLQSQLTEEQAKPIKTKSFATINQLKKDLAAKMKEHSVLEQQHSKAANTFAALQPAIQMNGFSVDPDTGHIVHVSGKKWSFKDALANLPAGGAVAAAAVNPDEFPTSTEADAPEGPDESAPAPTTGTGMFGFQPPQEPQPMTPGTFGFGGPTNAPAALPAPAKKHMVRGPNGTLVLVQ